MSNMLAWISSLKGTKPKDTFHDALEWVPSFENTKPKDSMANFGITFMHHDLDTEVTAEHIHDPATRTEITARNTKDSPLLRLPGEIRNEIYAYVYEECRGIYVFDPPKPPSERTKKGEIKTASTATPKPQVRLHPLLLTCRQTHDETGLMAFCSTHLRITILSAFFQIPASMS